LGVPKIRKIKKVTIAQDDDFVGVLKKNIPNKLALMGRSPFQRSATRESCDQEQESLRMK
jgi:hypothetical protein